MIKKSFFLFITLIMLFSWSAEAQEKTILFLIPFYSDSYVEQQLSNIHECEDIYGIKSFQLMGFWAGAQVALDEYEKKDASLKIIVKDVSESEAKLKSILENQTLMSQVDLIIGPFFSKQFALASRYAKEYKIPIINPFTNRTDILHDNEYVYKLVPSKEARPATLSYWADQFPNHQIWVYADTTQRQRDNLSYIQYFRQHNIPYKVIMPQKSVVSSLLPNKKNIVISQIEETAKNMMMARELVYSNKLDNVILVVPENLLKSNTVEIEYFSKLNVHFFSDYYVDYSNEQTQVFIHNFTDKFKTIPTLENFGFQGYDITRYFVELLLNDMDVDRVKIEPIAYRLSFDKTENGGYENVNTQFLEVIDNEIHPANY